jgi:hypothetical protein
MSGPASLVSGKARPPRPSDKVPCLASKPHEQRFEFLRWMAATDAVTRGVYTPLRMRAARNWTRCRPAALLLHDEVHTRSPCRPASTPTSRSGVAPHRAGSGCDLSAAARAALHHFSFFALTCFTNLCRV